MISADFDRKLAAILYADVVGFSRLTGQDEEGTHRTLSTYFDILSSLIKNHGGNIGHYAGDAVLADFPSVVTALQCAIKIQNELRRRNQPLSESRRLRFRIGINLGDVLIDRNEVHGDSVNITARLEAIADAGGICISGPAYDAVGTKLPLTYEFLGEQSLKNIDKPVRAYRVLFDKGSPSPTTYGETDRTEKSLKASIAVLPFEDLSQNKDQAYFCEGLTDDITTDLSKFSDLLVIDSHSTFAYKDRSMRARDIGRELAVHYLLEGSVQRRGTHVRINAQLIDTWTGHHVWGERFDREFDDILAVQDEILEMIVVALALNVDAAERQRAIGQSLSNIDSYDAYLRGKHEWWSYLYTTEDPNTLKESRRYFELATELDPHYARAWAWLTYPCLHTWLENSSDGTALEAANRAAARAVELDPLDYVCHWAIAYSHLYTGKIDLALTEYNTALKFNRNEANMLVEMTEALCYAGRCAEGADLIERAMKINPHFPGWYSTTQAFVYFCMKRYDDAIEELRKVTTLRRDDHCLLAASYSCNAKRLELEQKRGLAQEEQEKANLALEALLESDPEWTIEKERHMVHFKKASDEEHWIESLRLAALSSGRI